MRRAPSRYAREEWDRLAETLYAIGTLTAIDQNSLGGYCLAFARWPQAEEDLERMAQIDGSRVLKPPPNGRYRSTQPLGV